MATLAAFAHAAAGEEVLKDVLAGIGFGACEIASYKVLIALAGAAGADGDGAELEICMKEQQGMGDWLGEHMHGFVQAHLREKAA